MDTEKKLVTLAEFKTLTPQMQGFISYMQAEWPGSELKKHQHNPYPKGSPDYTAFQLGQSRGVQVAQDSEG